jgi:hypothetical protein
MHIFGSESELWKKFSEKYPHIKPKHTYKGWTPEDVVQVIDLMHKMLQVTKKRTRDTDGGPILLTWTQVLSRLNLPSKWIYAMQSKNWTVFFKTQEDVDIWRAWMQWELDIIATKMEGRIVDNLVSEKIKANILSFILKAYWGRYEIQANIEAREEPTTGTIELKKWDGSPLIIKPTQN